MNAKLAGAVLAGVMIGVTATAFLANRAEGQVEQSRASAWEQKIGALQYATHEGKRGLFFYELPIQQDDDVIARMKRLEELFAEGWEYVGTVSMYDVNIFDQSKAISAIAIRRGKQR